MKVSLSIPDKLVAEVDELRGDVSRSRFVTRAIEGHLQTNLAFRKWKESVDKGIVSHPRMPDGDTGEPFDAWQEQAEQDLGSHRQIPTGHGVRRVRSDG